MGAVTTHYVYDLGGNLIAEADGGTGAASSEYVGLDGMPLAYIQGGGVYFIHIDHLGTPQRVTDAAAAVVWDADYRPFGEATVVGALTFNLRFPGQYEDAETGLHYNYFRDYDPTTGRYIQSDPIGLGGGLNTYGYVAGNPVMRVDLLELSCIPYGPLGNRQWYCDGILDWMQKDDPIIPPNCCNASQLTACMAVAGASTAIPCAACFGTEPAGALACASCLAGAIETLYVCPAQNCTICNSKQLSCGNTSSSPIG